VTRSTEPTRPRLRAALLTLVLLTLAPLLGAQPSAAVGGDALADARRLLDWLGVDALLEQSPQIIAQVVQGEASLRKTPASTQAQWRQRLGAQTSLTPLRERVARRVATEVEPAVLARAAAALDAPLPRRARYFDLAMAQPGAGLGFNAWRTDANAPTRTPARRELIRAIVEASGEAARLAQWQTTLAVQVETWASGQDVPARLQEDAVRERTRFLAPKAEEFAAYAWRYLTDEELASYRDQLRSAEVQQVMEICRRNLARALTE
jgi:hypothetical protein